jgi:hypothetical protein
MVSESGTAIGPNCTSTYSYLSATMGSTRIACRAGAQVAPADVDPLSRRGARWTGRTPNQSSKVAMYLRIRRISFRVVPELLAIRQLDSNAVVSSANYGIADNPGSTRKQKGTPLHAGNPSRDGPRSDHRPPISKVHLFQWRGHFVCGSRCNPIAYFLTASPNTRRKLSPPIFAISSGLKPVFNMASTTA